MGPKTAFLASKMHVLGPRAISHRFRRPLDPILIDFQCPRTSKIIKNTLENKGFCYFALFHFASKKSPFRTRLGPPNPPKSLPKRLPGRPSGPKMASKPSLGFPRWPSGRLWAFTFVPLSSPRCMFWIRGPSRTDLDSHLIPF